MNKIKISLIAAIGKNRELGKDNKLLWHIPEDLKRFKKITLGHPVIMGRKTFESIGKPLPNRLNIIVSRSLKRSHPFGSEPQGRRLSRLNVVVAGSLEEAIEIARGVIASEAKQSNPSEIAAVANCSFAMTSGEVFIIGGGQIFEQAIKLADKLYLTIVDKNFEADTFFPDYSMFTKKVFEEKGEDGGYKYTFLELGKG